MLVTQSQFAAMKSVSRAAVTQWKSEGRVVIVGKLIDVAATERRLTTESRHNSKRVKPAASTVKSPELDVKPTLLVADDHYAAGVCTGMGDVARSVPALLAQAAEEAGVPPAMAAALDANIRAALLRRMELLLDLNRISPVVTADEDEVETIRARDTWIGRNWAPDTLDDASLIEDLAALPSVGS
jgi:hypothetical protein